MNSLFTEIERAIAETTDAELARFNEGVEDIAKTQRPIGVIHDIEVRKMFAASWRLHMLSEQRSIEAQISGDKALTADGQRLSAMADALRELCWCAACDSLGAWGDTGHFGYALRSGWMLVFETQSLSPLAQLLGLDR